MKVPFSEHLLWNEWKIGKAVIKETTYLRDLTKKKKDLFPALNALPVYSTIGKVQQKLFFTCFF